MFRSSRCNRQIGGFEASSSHFIQDEVGKEQLYSGYVTEGLSGYEIDLQDYERQYQLSDILEQFQRARMLGPRDGAAIFKTAETTKRNLLKNPFFKRGEIGEVLLNTEYYFTRLYLIYKRKAWIEALEHVTRALRLSLPDALHFHLFSCSLALVRDEYGVFQSKEKLTLISQLLSSLDKKTDLEQPSRAAFLLLVKSALLRWRGRSERGAIQRATYAEALRCCGKSQDLSRNPGGQMQKALINYSSALAFQIHEVPKHEPFLKACFEIMESSELTDFPPAIKYRPRLYRETYRFSDSIDAFWAAASRYPAEFKRVAYVIGEAAAGEYNHHDGANTQHLSDAKAYLQQAINEGYCHARNIISYIGCRGALEPDWFRSVILDKVLTEEGSAIEWEGLLARIRNSLFDPGDKYDEPAFGVDGSEFWATLGGVTGRILLDHENAIRFLQIAEHHGGKFRAYVGLTLQYKKIGDLANYKHYLHEMRTVARAP